jgi:hypothetical protein
MDVATGAYRDVFTAFLAVDPGQASPLNDPDHLFRRI